MEAQYLNDVKTHDDSISLQAYRPTSYFCTAVAWWDFFQIRSVATTKRTVQILRGARDIAASVAPKDVCIYSFIRTFGEMMPADQFIDAIDRSIKMIEEYAGPDLYRRDEEDILEPRGRLSSMLMTLNL